jgi:hypothetical protein
MQQLADGVRSQLRTTAQHNHSGLSFAVSTCQMM